MDCAVVLCNRGFAKFIIMGRHAAEVQARVVPGLLNYDCLQAAKNMCTRAA